MNNTDPAEPELAWRGYSGWAMLPSFTVCLLASIVLLTARWFVEEVSNLSDRVGTLVFFGATLLIWIVQILRWMYRGASYVYRLTPKHLFIDRGVFDCPHPPIDLTKVIKVEAGSNFLTSFFSAGWVHLTIEGREPVCLSGLLYPDLFAQEIEGAVNKARVVQMPA